MVNTFDLTEVPAVDASDFGFVLKMLIESGQGLALIRGLDESEIRAIEDQIWEKFPAVHETRLALALRFRALLAVFASRRLKALFLERGLRLFAAVAQEAASHRLNVRFGFNPQRMLLTLDAQTSGSISPTHEDVDRLALAA